MNEYRIEKENANMAKAGIEVFHQRFEGRGATVSPHIHTAVELLYITQGRFRMVADDVEYLPEEGDLILFRSNTIHRVFLQDGGPGSYYVIKLRPSFILELCSREQGSSYLLSLALNDENKKTLWTAEECKKSRISRAVERLFREWQEGGYGSDIAVKLSAAEILLALLRDTEACREQQPRDLHGENLARRIYNAIVYINKHYAEEITAEDCSRYVFMSYSYFSRSFKRITGRTFKDYLNFTRINHAEKALVSTEKSITEIAADCGFNNVSYFISTYKKAKGITPAAFRASLE